MRDEIESAVFSAKNISFKAVNTLVHATQPEYFMRFRNEAQQTQAKSEV